jgi:hypothetical protein
MIGFFLFSFVFKNDNKLQNTERNTKLNCPSQYVTQENNNKHNTQPQQTQHRPKISRHDLNSGGVRQFILGVPLKFFLRLKTFTILKIW